MKGKFKKKVGFIRFGGDFGVKLKEGSTHMDMSLKLVNQASGNRQVPGIQIQSFNFHIKSSGLDISLFKGVAKIVVEPFIWFFKSVIVNKINKAIENSVPKSLSSQLNSIFLKLNGFVPLQYKNYFVDVSDTSILSQLLLRFLAPRLQLFTQMVLSTMVIPRATWFQQSLRAMFKFRQPLKIKFSSQ